MDYKDFGKRIRKTRKKMGMTQEIVAEKLDIAPSYLSDIERGVKTPSLGVFIGLLKTLGVSADYILQGPLNSGKEYVYNEISHKLDQLTPKQRQFVSDFIDQYIKSME